MLNPFVVVPAVMLMLGLVYAAGRLIRLRRLERLQCPERRRMVDVRFARRLDGSWEPGAPKDVLECSEFPGTCVSCDKVCLRSAV